MFKQLRTVLAFGSSILSKILRAISAAAIALPRPRVGERYGHITAPESFPAPAADLARDGQLPLE